jgi:hypothetical protein
MSESSDLHLLDIAWGVIANVDGGSWDTQSADWREAAERWRDQYTARIGAQSGESHA